MTAVAAPPAPVAPADEVRRRRWPVHLVAAVAFTGLGLLVMGNFVGHPVDRVSDHLANDNTWFQWLLGHGAYSVRHLENPLFSVRQNYPVGVNIMANTSVLGVTIPLAPVTMLFGVRIAYLVWMVLALAGTAFSAYYVLQRWVVRSPVAAVLGGAFAGFAPGVVHHGNGQPNFVSNFALPFIVVAVMRLGVTGRWLRDGIVLGLLVTYQVFVNEEILVVTAGACGVAVLGYALLSPRAARERARHFAAALAVTAVVAGTLCAYPLWFQFNGPGTFTALPHYHAWGEDPVAYVTFSRDTLAGDASVERTIGRTEQNSWFGWPLVLVVLAAVGALIRRSMLVRVATFTAAVLAIFSMGPKLRWAGQLTDLPGVWHWIPDDLPVFGLLTPSRITFGVVGFVALMIAVAYDAAERVRGILSGVAMLAVIAALVPLIPTPLPARVDARPPQFITSGAWRDYVPPGHSLIPLPLPDDAGGRDSLSWAAWERSEFPVPEGYFLAPDADGIGQAGVEPSVLTTVVSDATRRGKIAQVTPELRAAVRVDIARFRGSVLVLRALPGYEPLRRMVDELVGPGEQFGDAWVWRVG